LQAVFLILGYLILLPVDLSLYLPDTNSTHPILVSLDSSIKMFNRDGSIGWKKDLQKVSTPSRCSTGKTEKVSEFYADFETVEKNVKNLF
jgi:hypothetical protein